MIHLKILSQIKKKIISGDRRSNLMKKNIIASFLLQGISMIVSFMMVPLLIDYVDITRYGIWLTISSFLSWFVFFEIGLGAGLKNKLSTSIANGNYTQAKIYLSTTYAGLTIIIGIVALLFYIFNNFLDWPNILNAPKEMATELNLLALIVFGFFFINFVIKLIGTVATAFQNPSISILITTLSSLVSFVIIWILTKTTNGNLVLMGSIISILPVLLYFIASIVLFNGKYKHIRPSIQYVKFTEAKDLLSLGAKFFVIQISMVVINSTSNIMIAQYFGPSEVTVFSVPQKLFSISNIVFSIIILPTWVAFSDALAKNDIKWIRETISKMLNIWILLSIGMFGILLISPWIYNVWLNGKVKVPFALSVLFYIYNTAFTFGGIYNMFINATGKIKIQLISLLIIMLLYIPVVILLIKYFNLGPISLAIGLILTTIYTIIIAPIQYSKIINLTAKGIWNS